MAPRWTYGNEGSAYPVQPGETWRCGAHTFACGSLMEAVSLGPATLVYADPPWNQGNLTSFATKAGLARPEHSWLDVYAQIVGLAGRRPCFIEGGRAEAGQVQAALHFRRAGAEEVRQWPVSYYRRHPAVLHYIGPPLAGLDPSGLDDDDTPGYVLSRFPRGVVADPCSGRGLTSRAAEEAGWPSVNIEQHPSRMSAALARLHKMTGCAVSLAAGSAGPPAPQRSSR